MLVKKTLKDYIDLLNSKGLIDKQNVPYELLLKEVAYLSYNSKKIEKDTLFFAKGLAFKPKYLDEAFEKGAFIYIAQKAFDENKPYIIVNDIRTALSDLAAFYFDSIWNDKLEIVGITGTKGKSTTSMFVKTIIDTYAEKHGKPLSGYSSGIYTFDGKTKEFAQKITTPEVLELDWNLYNSAINGLKYHVLETSSQGLKYKRVGAVKFKIGMFLTFGRDHISDREHPTMEDYFESKLMIYKQSEVGLVNLEFEPNLLEQIRKTANSYCKKVITFGRVEGSDYYGYNIHTEPNLTTFDLKYPHGEEKIVLKIAGEYNVVNALAAIASACELSIPMEYIKEGLSKAFVPGRMEIHRLKNKDVDVIIDEAHNELSFNSLFTSINELYPGKKILLVLGAKGNNAQVRRHDMGVVAEKYADSILFTSQDPGTEPVKHICDEIAQYVSKEKIVGLVEDRTEAIYEALDMAKEGYVVVLIGNGADHYHRIGNGIVFKPTDGETVEMYIKEHE